jgi:hypothetical protein
VTEIATKIILALYGNLPMSIGEIAEAVRGTKKVNARNCEQKCKYHLQNLEADEIIESFTDGKKMLYKIKENVELLDGKLVLGEDKYVCDVYNVLRRTDEDGEILISLLQ